MKTLPKVACALALSMLVVAPALGRPRTLTNSVGMKFVLIPAGGFMMGSPPTELYRFRDEGPSHRVVISRPFYLQTTEVTQTQWRAVMGTHPSYFKNCDHCPVEQVSWTDAQEFIRRLNAREKTNKYRLPTEAEWEYACRAGTTTPYHLGPKITTDQANYSGTSGRAKFRGKTTPVAGFRPNRWGLFDMHGNVWEWCQDWYGRDFYKKSPTRDPRGPATGRRRVLRGGSWYEGSGRLRSAARRPGRPESRYDFFGFRVARDL
jgi:formylglycine-generating enzyme required for sulfatase activity